MSNQDWAIAFTIVGLVLAITLPVTISMIMETPKTDYEVCTNRCPQTFSGSFESLECPMMCERLNKCRQAHEGEKNGN